MLIYVAGAIDRAAVADYGFDELISALLMAHAGKQNIDEAMQLFTPARGWIVNGRSTRENAKTLIGINMEVVKNADILVVRYDRNVETWGTPMEIQLAYHNHDTPIYIWSRVEDSAGDRPDYIDAQDLLPIYLLPYAQDEKVWCNLNLMATEIMNDYAARKNETEEDPEIGAFLDILRSI